MSQACCVFPAKPFKDLEDNGISVRGTYAKLTDTELDDIVMNILQEFPNSGYKSMRGHLLSQGHKFSQKVSQRKFSLAFN